MSTLYAEAIVMTEKGHRMIEYKKKAMGRGLQSYCRCSRDLVNGPGAGADCTVLINSRPARRAGTSITSLRRSPPPHPYVSPFETSTLVQRCEPWTQSLVHVNQTSLQSPCPSILQDELR